MISADNALTTWKRPLQHYTVHCLTDHQNADQAFSLMNDMLKVKYVSN